MMMAICLVAQHVTVGDGKSVNGNNFVRIKYCENSFLEKEQLHELQVKDSECNAIFWSMVLCKFVNGIHVYASRKCEALPFECIRLSKRLFDQ